MGRETISQPLSMPQARQRLVSRFGPKAPSMATLKRWSAAGALAHCQVKATPGGRPSYDLGRLERFVVGWLAKHAEPAPVGGRPGPGARSEPAPAGQDQQMVRAALAPDLERLRADLLGEMREMVRELIRDMTPADPGAAQSPRPRDASGSDGAVVSDQLLQAIKTLEASRRALMLKYDAEVQGLRSRADAAEAALAHARAQAAPLEATRLATALTRISHTVDHIAHALNERDPALPAAVRD